MVPSSPSEDCANGPVARAPLRRLLPMASPPQDLACKHSCVRSHFHQDYKTSVPSLTDDSHPRANQPMFEDERERFLRGERR